MGAVFLTSSLLLAGCSQLADSQPKANRSTPNIATKVRHTTYDTKGNIVNVSGKQKETSPLDGLSQDYKEIANDVANYQLPAKGRSNKKDQGLIVYNNGYEFNKNGQMVEVSYNGQTKPKPTKGQYLGVIMGLTADIQDDVGDPKNAMLGNTKDIPKSTELKTQVELFKFNEQDIQKKLNRINEMKQYTENYPTIKKKLDEMKSTFTKAQSEGKSTKTIRQATKDYENGVKQVKSLLNAYKVGEEL